MTDQDPATHTNLHTQISEDDPGHAEAALGPIDWSAWFFAGVGVVAGLVVLAAFWLALN